MPLRDHALEPYCSAYHTQNIHGGWPMVIADTLNEILPPEYRFGVRVHLGRWYEADVSGYELGLMSGGAEDVGGGTAALIAPAPTMTKWTEAPDDSDYGVDIYEATSNIPGKLVASIEFVSPSNKDRPESRRAFAAKCAALWRNKICVSIVDLISLKNFNLYADALDLIGHSDPAFSDSPSTYAATFRGRNGLPHHQWQLECWAYRMEVGQPLPTLPVWLNEKDHILVDLDATYEQTIRKLRLDSNPR